ncbi:MAG: SIR2 family protein [candidate division WOR-3 bacterium]|nr:SIR2 family protein [candidate division WOR-3 bacterium]
MCSEQDSCPPPPGFDLERERDNALERVVEALSSTPLTKVVTIWGAGASVNSGYASGGYLRDRMRNELKGTIGSDDEAGSTSKNLSSDVRNEIANYRVNGIPADITLGRVLRLYAALHGVDKLWEWLKFYIPLSDKRTKPPYFPSLSHEVCAHLANSGLLKFFIVLNFDELVEQALADEMGRTEFEVVASKSEFERLKQAYATDWGAICGHPEAKAFVLKPHGTISRGLTLRHFPELVHDFEPEKQPPLAEAMRDSVLLFLGFANEDGDFQKLLQRTFACGTTGDAIVVSRRPWRLERDVLTGSKKNDVYLYSGEVDDFFRSLAERLYVSPVSRQRTCGPGELGPCTRQKPIRHLIRGRFFDLFARRLRSKDDEAGVRRIDSGLTRVERGWYDKRAYELELLMYLMKTRGLFIQIATADCLRIGAAYRRCLDWDPIDSLEPCTVLERMLNADDQLIGHCDVMDHLDMKAINAQWCFLRVPEALRTRPDPIKDSIDLVAERYCQHLVKKITEVKVLSGFDIPGSAMERLRAELPGRLLELTRGFDVDVGPVDVASMMRFVWPKPLHRRSEFDAVSVKLLQTDWNRLRVATISAEWLARERLAELKAAIQLSGFVELDILSNLDIFTDRGTCSVEDTFHYQQMVKSIAFLLSGLATAGRVYVRWYVVRNLGHHVVIASKSRGQELDEDFIGAMYFRRLGKDTTVHPIYLEGQADIKTLASHFDARSHGVGDQRWHTCDSKHGMLFSAAVADGQTEVTGPPVESEPSLYRTYGTLLQHLVALVPNLRVRSQRVPESPPC